MFSQKKKKSSVDRDTRNSLFSLYENASEKFHPEVPVRSILGPLLLSNQQAPNKRASPSRVERLLWFSFLFRSFYLSFWPNRAKGTYRKPPRRSTISSAFGRYRPHYTPKNKIFASYLLRFSTRLPLHRLCWVMQLRYHPHPILSLFFLFFLLSSLTPQFNTGLHLPSPASSIFFLILFFFWPHK